MDLVVEESNKPARNLYSKLGYTVISKDTASDTLVPTDDVMEPMPSSVASVE